MAGNKYLTGKEIRKITTENAKEMRRLEKYKNRRAPESEFVRSVNGIESIAAHAIPIRRNEAKSAY